MWNRRTIWNPFDVRTLQNDIERLSNWPLETLIRFNTEKCVVIILLPRQVKDSILKHHLNGEPLRCANRQHNLVTIAYSQMPL